MGSPDTLQERGRGGAGRPHGLLPTGENRITCEIIFLQEFLR